MRSYEFARSWIEKGYEVSVLCGGTDTNMKHEGLSEVDGIKVIRHNVDYGPTYGVLKRCFRFLEFAWKSSRSGFKHDHYDLVYASSTPITVAIPALLLKLIRGTPFIFEVRDVWPDAVIPSINRSTRILISPARLLEYLAYRYATSIIVLSSGMFSRLVDKKNVVPERITVIPNSCDLDRFLPVYQRRMERVKQSTSRLSAPLRIIYIGTINRVNDLQFLLNVCSSFSDASKVRWSFVGDGHGLSWLRNELNKRNAENVEFHGYVVKEQCKELLYDADVGLISFLPDDVYYENSPNKFFDYISAGLPVIFNRTTWLENIIQQENIGVVSHNSDLETIAAYVESLRSDRQLLIKASEQARKVAETHFDRTVMATEALDVCIQAGATYRTEATMR